MYDVLIAGAGPAGSAVATLLAEQGLRVLLLEKERFPRYKACGGGIDGLAMHELGRMDIDASAVWENEASELRVTSGGRHPAIYRFDRPFAMMTMRSAFDALIAKTAVNRGAEFHDGEPIRSIVDSGSAITVTTDNGRYDGRLLVGADGVYSVVARFFGLNRDPILYVLTSSELEVDADVQAQWRERSQIDISVWPLGYGWVFPKRSHLSIGTGVPRRSAHQLTRQFKEFGQRLGLGNAEVIHQQSHMIGFRREGAPIALDRVLLVGDAAGLVDPNTGGGIGWALRSARFASKAILSYFLGETDGLSGYSKIVDQEIGREFRAARILRNSIILRFILTRGRATRDEGIWKPVVRVIRGDERYSDWYARSKLVKWLAWTTRIDV